MNQTIIINLATQALLLILIISLPPILAATFVGVSVSLLQALTQIQEQTLGFILKLTAVVGVLIFTAHWIGGQLLAYTQNIFDTFPWMT